MKMSLAVSAKYQMILVVKSKKRLTDKIIKVIQ